MFMSLRNFLGYNIDYITVWEHIIAGYKDELGRPLKKWKKTVYKGKWENSIKIIRSMSGNSVSSTGNAILPVLIDITKEILIEKGITTNDKPTTNAKKIITFEEITQIRKSAEEWIYYV